MRRALLLSLTPLLLACPAPKAPKVAAPAVDRAPASAEEFKTVDPRFSFGTAPLRTRWDLDDRGALDRAKMSVGDFYGRLRAIYGPPSIRDDAGFTYVLRHVKTGLIITAHSTGAGPSYGGGYRVDEGAPPPKPEEALQLVARAGQEPSGFLDAVRRLEAVLASATLTDCEVVYRVDRATLRSGVRDGQPFDEALPSSDAFLHALADYEREGDKGELFHELGDRALDLWLELDDETRETRAAEGARVATYWSNAVARLAAEPVLEENEQIRTLRWSQLWRTRAAGADAKALDQLESLKPDPWPAALEALKP